MSKIKSDITIWKEKLKNGADINEPDGSGLTALEQAILDDNISAVEFCIKQGADVNLNNKPIFFAADCSKKPEMIELLVSPIDNGRGDSSGYNRSFTLKAGMINS